MIFIGTLKKKQRIAFDDWKVTYKNETIKSLHQKIQFHCASIEDALKKVKLSEYEGIEVKSINLDE